jgi:hypothetical protein
MSNEVVMDDERRRELLDAAVVRAVAKGAHVEWQSGSRAVVVFGGNINHLVHAVIALLTAGLWLIGWIIIMVRNRERRVVLEVDRFGELHVGDESGHTQL